MLKVYCRVYRFVLLVMSFFRMVYNYTCIHVVYELNQFGDSYNPKNNNDSALYSPTVIILNLNK